MDALPVIAASAVIATVILVGVSLRRRIEALASRLAELDRLEELEQRLAALADAVEDRPLTTRLQARFTEFSEELARLTAVVTELKRQRAAEPPPSAPVPDDVVTVVRHHLTAAGFERVQMLTDATELVGFSGRVAFEASRHGVTHKGHVTVKDGVVVDDRIRAAYSAFP